MYLWKTRSQDGKVKLCSSCLWYCTQAVINLQYMDYQNIILKKHGYPKIILLLQGKKGMRPYTRQQQPGQKLWKHHVGSKLQLLQCIVLKMTKTFITKFYYLCKCNYRFQRPVLPFSPLLLYLAISSGLLCYCNLYSNEYMQVTCLHIVRSFPPFPALPSTQFTKLQKHGAGSHMKHSSQMSTKF